mmetsp:Transcript_1766/g.6612  ORF Transcript_1766/g.6612 Transcript_1766/m.6612 type:complete len:1060 (-) Transcript_1766:507-3686(-)
MIGFQFVAGGGVLGRDLRWKTCDREYGRARFFEKKNKAVRSFGFEPVKCSLTAGKTAYADVKLPENPNLRRGTLPNGFEYNILPNDSPSGRFEAHLEVFAGSTVEDEDQQGIAHVVEHVAYMGSEKRERLLSGTGASTNAHTDFHHTVFFAACPTYIPRTGRSSMVMALDALLDVMEAKIEPARVEKERAAILSEMLMVNTIEYRVECQLLASLHAENVIPNRFPIGLEEQIKAWTADDVKRFHRTHYRPNNAVLYVAGDFDSVDKVEEEIVKKFSNLKNYPIEKDVAKGTLKETRSRHFPAVVHDWSNLITPLDAPTDVRLFRHELLSSFSLHVYAKNPLQEVKTMSNFRRSVLRKLGYSALQIRLNMAGRSEELAGDCPFSTVEFLDQDSPREACEVRSLDLTAKPSLWRVAVRVAVREMRRFARYGFFARGVERLRVTLLNMSQQSIMQHDMATTPDRIEDLMEAVAAGHTYLTPDAYYELLEEQVLDISLEEINEHIKDMCSHSLWFEPNSKAPSPNAIVACAPTSIPDLTTDELMKALKEAGSEPIEPPKDVDVPQSLMSRPRIIMLMQDKNAYWVSSKVNAARTFMLGKLMNGVAVNMLRSPKKSGRACMRVTCPGGRSVEVKSLEPSQSGIPHGAVALGSATVQEGGAIGGWSREQIELYCIDNLVEVYAQVEEGSIHFDFIFPSERFPSVLQILRGLMTDFKWEGDAFARGRESLEQRCREVESSLEERSKAELLKLMTGGDLRFSTPRSEALQSLTLTDAKDAMIAHLATEGTELSIVGDFEMSDVADLIRTYIGSVPARKSSILNTLPRALTIEENGKDIEVEIPDTDARSVVYVAGKMPSGWGYNSDGTHAFLEKNSFGKRAPRDVLLTDTKARRNHPLFAYVGYGLLREVLTRRMFSELREEANLSYEANFKVIGFDNVNGGYYLATATAAPKNAKKALEVVKRTLAALRDGKSSITWANLENARRSVTGRFEGGMEGDGYIVQMMSGMQHQSNPLKAEQLFEDLLAVTDSVTVRGVPLAKQSLRSLRFSRLLNCALLVFYTPQSSG